MAQTVIGVFDTSSEAQRAVETLISRGFSRDNIDVASQSSASAGDSDYTSGATSGSADHQAGTSGSSTGSDLTSEISGAMGYPMGSSDLGTSDRSHKSGHEESGITRFFKSLFGDDDDNATRFSNVARRSGSIITVHAQTNDEAERAADILDEMGAVDVDERANQFGYGSGAASMGTGTGDLGTASTGLGTATSGVGLDTTASSSSAGFDQEATRSIPIIEENLEVGKRTVERGGARLRSRIIERPVEESLRLREERIRVERNTVDRPASEADFAAFKEGTIELTEHAEVPVVAKEARVVEEISLGKDVEERTETIKDTVRRTEVDIEDIDKNSDVRGTNTKNDLLD